MAVRTLENKLKDVRNFYYHQRTLFCTSDKFWRKLPLFVAIGGTLRIKVITIMLSGSLCFGIGTLSLFSFWVVN